MEALQREYEKLLNAQRFDPRELDYSVLERHISQLTLLSQVSNSGITVFDMYTRRHAFASYNFAELFQYDLESIATEDSDYFTGRIHPDDRKELHRNGIACLRYLMDHKELAPDVKLIDEYRVDVGGRYVRVIEQFQVLEFDRSGNIWLSLSILAYHPIRERRAAYAASCSTIGREKYFRSRHPRYPPFPAANGKYCA